MAERSRCQGLYWDPTGESKCVKCGARNECLAEFARGELAEKQKSLDDPTPAELSLATGVCPESIEAAIEFQKNSGLGPVEPLPDYAPAPPYVRVPGPVEAPKPFEAPIQEAKPPAEEKSLKWDPRHDAERWNRERARSPLIARLTPGMVIRKKYKGNHYEVAVLSDGYSYKDVKYPTLYAAMVAITGKVEGPNRIKDGKRLPGTRMGTTFSSARFFNLYKILEGK